MSFKSFLGGLISGAAVTIGGLLFYQIKPNFVKKDQKNVVRDKYIAHRGLYNHSDTPENSIPAFKAAMDHGYAIELDVQTTKDGRLIVFHDDSLERMCGVDQLVSESYFKDLKKYHLGDTDQTIPLFSRVLKLVDGKVPLLIEVKKNGNWLLTSERLLEELKEYDGFYTVISFKPEVLDWYKVSSPNTIRGQLSTDYFVDHPEMSEVEKFTLTNYLDNYLSRPDFILYNYKFRNDIGFRIFGFLFPEVERVAWTIKSQEELDEAKKYYDAFIFENFLPEEGS